jgi:hypothetical protein
MKGFGLSPWKVEAPFSYGNCQVLEITTAVPPLCPSNACPRQKYGVAHCHTNWLVKGSASEIGH